MLAHYSVRRLHFRFRHSRLGVKIESQKSAAPRRRGIWNSAALRRRVLVDEMQDYPFIKTAEGILERNYYFDEWLLLCGSLFVMLARALLYLPRGCKRNFKLH